MSSQTPTICPRCQQPFDCGVDEIRLCHCSATPLTQYQRDYVSQRWQSCLCSQCLVHIKRTVPAQAD